MAQKKKDNHIIVAIHVTDRVKQASRVQSVLTKYGGYIKTRIGLHEAKGKAASPNGLILLELVGADSCCRTILANLNAVSGVEAKSVIFEH
ncbi:MAG: hypothetical protein WAX69_25675 [Victivallales bacterium]